MRKKSLDNSERRRAEKDKMQGTLGMKQERHSGGAYAKEDKLCRDSGLSLCWRDYDFERACLVTGGRTLELAEAQRDRILHQYRRAWVREGRAPRLGEPIFPDDLDTRNDR